MTEFLPVSSSGHLVLGGYFLGLRESHLFFDVMVHVATLVATLVFYRATFATALRESARALVELKGGRPLSEVLTDLPGARLALLVGVGSVPTGLIGIVGKDALESLFAAPRAAALMLVLTGGLLAGTRWARPGERGIGKMGVWEALLIGLVQGLAIVPGVSRSGSTIAVALMLGLEREFAARFSFVLAVPAVAGALVLQLMKPGFAATVGFWPLSLGFAAAAVSGVWALSLLIPLLRRGHFYYFSLYLFPVGIGALVLLS